MKKRSLFAAVAMLIVSAIVLTSATYAWFASNSSASAGEVSATITESDGSILVSGDGGTTWKTTLATADITNGSFVNAQTGYTPVSCTVSATPAFIGGNLNGADFKCTTATQGTQYTKYTIKVKSSVDAKIVLTPTFASDVNYGMGLIVVGSSFYLFGGDTTNFQSIASSNTIPGANDSAQAVDTNNNKIVDGADNPQTLTLNTNIAATNPSSINLGNNIAANTVTSIDLYLWAEGQHPDCKGSVDGADIGFTLLQFSRQTAVTGG